MFFSNVVNSQSHEGDRVVGCLKLYRDSKELLMRLWVVAGLGVLFFLNFQSIYGFLVVKFI